jgi:hypothetical protein
MDTLIVKKEYTIDASMERTWDLLGMMVFDSMKMEDMKVLDERNFKADLRVKAYGISLKMHLVGKMTDVVIPEKLVVEIKAKGFKDLLSLVLRITMALKAVDKDKTVMYCEATGEDLNFIFKYIAKSQVKAMSNDIFDSIAKGIKELA